jgi:hypothetical protein
VFHFLKYRGVSMKNKFSIAMSLAVVLAMLLTSLALADTLNGDALVAQPGTQDVINRIVSGGDTVTYDFGAWIAETGNANDDVFTSGASLNVGINRVGDWLDTPSGTPSSFTFSAYNAQQTGTIAIYVPCDTAGIIKEMTVELLASTSTNGESLDPQRSSVTLRYRIQAGSNGSNCAATNAAPSVDAGGSYSGAEGSAISLDGTVSDPDGDTLTTTWTYAIVSADPGAACSFGNASAVDTTITCNDDGTFTVTLTANDGVNAPVSDSADVTVSNANPLVATPAWATASVACRVSATLTNISFSDAGVIDYPWTVDINWNDGSTSFNTNSQAGQLDQTHTYNTPGTYAATVMVTDKDGGSGSNSTATSLNVLQTYTVNFLQPFDNSSPSNLITNTMKSGRTVPVKVTIYDDCAQAYVTDPASLVRINLLTGPATTGNDAIEVYADAGASNGNTLYFRWTSDSSAPGGGFWIYNLDSRTVLNGSALALNTTYRVDVFVGAVKATNTKWALLKPVK